MMHTQLAKQYKRLDDAALIKFLTSSTAAFIESNYIGPHDAENLRINLTSINFGEDSEYSIVSHLDQRGDEILKLLEIRFGTQGVWTNLLRYTWVSNLAVLRESLAGFAAQLLQQSSLLLNRPFTIYLNGRGERKTVLASLSVDLADLLANACERIERCEHELRFLLRSDILGNPEVEDALDLKIAQALDFHGCADENLCFLRENSVKDELCSSLNHIGLGFRFFLTQLKENYLGTETSNLLIQFDRLNSLEASLDNFHFPESFEIPALEKRRFDLLSLCFEITDLLKLIQDRFSTLLSKCSSLSQKEEASSTAQSIGRTIAYSLSRDGLSPIKALPAAQALLNYCSKHGVTPDKILPAELPQISPYLSFAALERFQQISENTKVAQVSGKEKQRALSRSVNLKTHLEKWLPAILVITIFVITTTLSGCGVKMDPTSELLDLRPPIDYHSGARAEQRKLELNHDALAPSPQPK